MNAVTSAADNPVSNDAINETGFTGILVLMMLGILDLLTVQQLVFLGLMIGLLLQP